MSLSAHLEVHLHRFELSLELAVSEGEVVALVGPNGAGKTTVIRALAGLVPLRAGRIQLAEATFADPATGTHLLPAERHIGVVFQEHRLLAHLSALDNVAFGLRAAGHDRRDARERAANWLDRVGLASLRDARPSELSGGQAQRVALARTLATEPRLLLLDEPMAALDVDTRRDMQQLLASYLDAHRGPAVLVTHDPAEAMALADRLVVIEQGRVTQTGAPDDVAANPGSAWAASLLGT